MLKFKSTRTFLKVLTTPTKSSTVLHLKILLLFEIKEKMGDMIFIKFNQFIFMYNFNPSGQPCKVNMSGTPQNLAIATQLVQEAMLGVKSQGGGMGQQGGYGGETKRLICSYAPSS